MHKFVVFTVLIITVYQLDAQTKLITVEKGYTILVGADMRIVIPAKKQLKKVVQKEYVNQPQVINIQLPENQYYPQLPVPQPVYPVPVRYQDQPVDVDMSYKRVETHTALLVFGTLGFILSVVALALVYAERGRRKDEYHMPPTTNNTFHVSGGHVDSSKNEESILHDNRTYGEPDMVTANAIVKQWQHEQKTGTRPSHLNDDTFGGHSGDHLDK